MSARRRTAVALCIGAVPVLLRRGDAVIVLQKYLDVLLKDSKLSRDGIFGPRTERPCARFRRGTD